MRKFIPFAAAALLLPAALLVSQQPDNAPFLEKPYLQLGNSPKLTRQESLVLLWHTTNSPAQWTVEVRTSKDSKWRAMPAPASDTVSAPAGPPLIAGRDGAKKDAPPSPAIERHLVYRAKLTGLLPGEEFHYRVLKDGRPVFESAGKPRKSMGQPYRFALFGDSGEGTPAEKAVAYQTYLAKPDFVVIPGDIVYSSGRISEHRDRFFPQYNAEQPGPDSGAPLLRSVPFIAVPGNHDSALANYARYPDALAYFLYWDLPLNGPQTSGMPGASHILTANPSAQPVFLAAAGSRYPRMANFSFDYGNTHWVLLDANTYMDWSNPALQDWLKKDLDSARSATWRFVAFHQPGFNSAKTHFTEQQMRVLSPIFEAEGVDIVFAGHVHNYQRSFPMKFVPAPRPPDVRVGGPVAGEWTLDKSFGDGAKTKPQGVIYIVSGGGGAGLYNPEQQEDPATWQPFTDKFISKVHSLTIAEVDGKTFRMKQISDTGDVVDSFRIAK